MAVQMGITEKQAVDTTILKAIAGTSAQVPVVGSMVYYFPQGHAEQATSPPRFTPFLLLTRVVLCQVLAVQYCADRESDEVFVKISLAPRSRNFIATEAAFDRNENYRHVKVRSFEKILRLSDEYNAFYVPQECARYIFPPLNYQAHPHGQIVSVTDVHGAAWEFRYISQGNSRLLADGWAAFTNHKRLKAGDSIVFVKNQTDQVYVGIRRAAKSEHCGKLSPESVIDAAQLAAQNMPFEVAYYLKATSHPYVVNAESVDSSLKVEWTAGTRVRLRMDSSRSKRRSRTSFEGVVFAMHPDQEVWRMLEIRWDEPEMLSDMGRASPWQVEHVVSSSSVITNLAADAVSPSTFLRSSFVPKRQKSSKSRDI